MLTVATGQAHPLSFVDGEDFLERAAYLSNGELRGEENGGGVEGGTGADCNAPRRWLLLKR